MPFRALSSRLRMFTNLPRTLLRPFGLLRQLVPKAQGAAISQWLDSLRPQRAARRRQRVSSRAQFSQIHLVQLSNSKRTVLHIGTNIGRKTADFPLQLPNREPITLQFTLVDPAESLIPMRLTCLPPKTPLHINEVEAASPAYLSNRDTITVAGQSFLYELYAMDSAPVVTRVDASWATITGPVRDRNEDALGLFQHPKGYLFAIADGVGSGQDGDRISAFSVQYLLAVFHKNVELGLAWRDIFATAYQYINSEVRHFAQTALGPTGSTLTAVVIQDWEAQIAHAGDSRVYRWRNGSFEQCTVDHVKRLPAELPTRFAYEATTPPPLHDVLTRAIGKEDSIQPDFVTLPLRPGDRLLLVTDGLAKHVSSGEMSTMLAQLSISQVAHKLVDLAAERGTDDNASAIAIDVLSEAYLEDSWQAVDSERVYAGHRPRSLRLKKREETQTSAPLISDGCLFAAVIVFVILGLILLLGLTVTAVSAQADEPTDQAVLFAYQCAFDAEQQTLNLNVAFHDATGLPFPANAYQLAASVNGATEPFSAEAVSVAANAVRPPLRMVLVLDLTDTVPIDNVLNAINRDLLPELQPQDEVALITFGDEVSPPTRFYTDKAQLFADYLVGLTTVEGDNRLYEAISDAVDLMPFDSDRRQAILVLTDSGRRDSAQTAIDQIITRATANGTQLYTIGFTSEDRPDFPDLTSLAVGTQGFAWSYDETPNTPASIESALSAHLRNYLRLIDSEINVTLDASSLTSAPPDGLPITLTADVLGVGALTTAITCPFEVIEYEVTFTGTPIGAPIRGTADIGVVVTPPTDDVRIVFRVDGEVVQNSTATLYTLAAAQLAPGEHQVAVELWNRRNETLATTAAPLRLFTQLPLDLTVAGDTAERLSGAVTLTVATTPDFAPDEVEVAVARRDQPDEQVVLGTIELGSDGRGTLEIADISAAVQALFPQLAATDRLQAVARVPNTTPNQPALALSGPLTFSVAAPVQAVTTATTSAPVNAGLVTLVENWPLLGTLFFGAINLLLFRAVRGSRIRRLINHADDHDLSPQLMSLTVYRGGVPQHYTLTKKTVTIGRSSSNDINLGEDPNISRKHGVVMWRRRNWYYSNRKNGLSTRINGRRRIGFIFERLEPMTELQIGGATLVFHPDSQQNISDFIKTDL
ncbi:MAG: protein phosphatase 2C domain-containing protein [Chloroflexi bacterium]|nr:protein phosphatase 2C domain-containing protein [Chloroflexota bacterium]